MEVRIACEALVARVGHVPRQEDGVCSGVEGHCFFHSTLSGLALQQGQLAFGSQGFGILVFAYNPMPLFTSANKRGRRDTLLGTSCLSLHTTGENTVIPVGFWWCDYLQKEGSWNQRRCPPLPPGRLRQFSLSEGDGSMPA